MLTSHLAIIDRRGLRKIADDTAEAYASLARQIDFFDSPPSVLIWAVISDDALSRVRHQLHLGDGRTAWSLMQSLADQIGSVRTGPLTSADRRNFLLES